MPGRNEEIEDVNERLQIPCESLNIATYYPLPNGQGRPTEVVLLLRLDIIDANVIVRFKSKAGLQQFLDELKERGDEVWSDT